MTAVRIAWAREQQGCSPRTFHTITKNTNLFDITGHVFAAKIDNLSGNSHEKGSISFIDEKHKLYMSQVNRPRTGYPVHSGFTSADRIKMINHTEYVNMDADFKINYFYVCYRTDEAFLDYR